MQDYFGKEIKIGDYLIYPYVVGNHSVELQIVKVVKFAPRKTAVLKINWNGNSGITYINFPQNGIIISEELAFKKEPRFKELK